MKTKKKNLIFIAGMLWVIAGLNILKIGIGEYSNNFSIFNLLISTVIFLLFWFLIFSKMVNKHCLRIMSYENEKENVFKFFDKKSYILMFFMITLGIVIRNFQILSLKQIAVFYTGLGSALTLSGIKFLYKYTTKNGL